MRTGVLLRVFGYFVVILLTSGHVEAAEKYEFYNGVRGLGMGGARIAVVNDETSLMVNPAALGKLRDYFVTVADPEVSLGADTQAMIGADVSAFMDPQTVLDTLKTNLGTNFHQRATVFPSFVVQNFGVGVYGNYVTNAQVDAADTIYTLNYRNDFAVVMGFNFRFFDGKVKLGFNARGVNRVEIDRNDIASNSTGLTIESLAKEGFGIGSDVGLILTAPWKALPTLAIVYRDAGDTHFNVNEGLFYNTTERPVRKPATLDAAFALFPLISNRTRFVFTGEYRDVLSEEQEDLDDAARRIHAGMEINFSDAFFLRAGYHQRYWTAGLEISMMNYQIQFATYGEEIGTAATPKEERRYIGKFAFRF